MLFNNNKNITFYSKNYKINYIGILIIIIIIILLYRCLYINNLDTFVLNVEQDESSPTTYIICENFYNVMEDYIISFYKKLNAKILTFNTPNEIQKLNKKDIYIFVKYIHKDQLEQLNEQTNNVYLINTEQLSILSDKDRLNSYPKYIKILDYSKENLKYYNGYYTKFLQYQLNLDEIYNLPKTKDICIMQPNVSPMSEYRQKIIDNLKEKNIIVDLLSGWKKERDEKLFTYKILLNIGYSDKHKIFESLRCDRCIFNKMIVISEKKEDYENYYFKDYMIFEDYDKIADKTIEVLNNYDMYYKKLGLDTLDLNKLQFEPVSL